MKKISKKFPVLIAIVLAVGAFAMMGCGEPKMERLFLTPPTITSYNPFDDLNLTGFTAQVIYSNGDAKEIPIEELEFGQITELAPGTKAITVKYQGLTAEFPVNVEKDVTLIFSDTRKIILYPDHTAKYVQPRIMVEKDGLAWSIKDGGLVIDPFEFVSGIGSGGAPTKATVAVDGTSVTLTTGTAKPATITVSPKLIEHLKGI